MTKMPECAICGKPAAALLTDFPVCEACHAAITSDVDICFECGAILGEGEEVFCGECDPDAPQP